MLPCKLERKRGVLAVERVVVVPFVLRRFDKDGDRVQTFILVDDIPIKKHQHQPGTHI